MKSGSILERALEQGQFVVTAEIMPPKTPSPALIQKRTLKMKDYLTAANLTDNQSGTVRISSVAASKIVLDCGVDPVMQITCRDRNRMAIQADVIGAAALGIRNILCVTGDHQMFGDHPETKNVFDIDSLSLIRMLKRMRDDGIFQNGQPIRNRKKSRVVAPQIFIGAAANPFGSPQAFRPYRLLKKVRSGADFVQTQPIFDVSLFKEWLDKVRELGGSEELFILGGITPVKSARALHFMKENVPGVHIPDTSIKRMESAADQEEEGFNMACELIRELQNLDGVHGVHLMAIGWEKIIPKIVNHLRLNPGSLLPETH